MHSIQLKERDRRPSGTERLELYDYLAPVSCLLIGFTHDSRFLREPKKTVGLRKVRPAEKKDDCTVSTVLFLQH